jgi:hypothetical protein
MVEVLTMVRDPAHRRAAWMRRRALRCTSAHATIAVPSTRGGALPTAASQQTRLDAMQRINRSDYNLLPRRRDRTHIIGTKRRARAPHDVDTTDRRHILGFPLRQNASPVRRVRLFSDRSLGTD